MGSPRLFPKDIKTRLYNFKRELIINEMHKKHRDMYQKVSMVLDQYIHVELDLIKKNKDEITYFMDQKEIVEEDINKKLLKDHYGKLAAKLQDGVESIPGFIIEFAQEELKLMLNHDKRLFENDDNEFEHLEGQNYEDIQEEWYNAVFNISDNIRNEKIKFWDKSILESKPSFIDSIFEIFLLSQKVKNK